MKREMFKELVDSVREGGSILRSEQKASRRVRCQNDPGKNQALPVGVCSPDWRQREDPAELGTGPAPSGRTCGCVAEDYRARTAVGCESYSSCVAARGVRQSGRLL